MNVSTKELHVHNQIYFYFMLQMQYDKKLFVKSKSILNIANIEIIFIIKKKKKNYNTKFL